MTAAEGDRPLKGYAVLLVEDKLLQRSLLERILRSLGPSSLAVAADGREALALLAANPAINLLITDLQMPVMDGVELLRHLGQRKLDPALVLMSATDPAILGAAERVAKAYGLNILATVAKPLTRTGLIALAALGRGGSPSRPAASGGPLRLMDEHAIRRAVRAGRLIPYFQPKVNLATGALAGAEVLARLSDADGSLISPGAFIPVIETEAMLALDFTLEVASVALRDLAAWDGPGQTRPVSVNLPSVCLCYPATIDALLRETGQFGAVNGDLTWEVTETAAIANYAVALEVLTRLRLMGFGIAIDDYGTGHSSMERLASIPFTEVKIDRSFVSGSADSAQKRMILGSTIRLVRELGMTCVAEGAETEAEVAVLRELGCDVVQGYAVARPMPVAAFRAWAEARDANA
jgi:EAL domain-containing protein (putative c-di-GMP-specific phosphodiesterase class I)/CheY-like chemotaxis protein